MIAFHFPPYQGGSGVHRTLKFCRYLPEFGWAPIVLTAHPRAYPNSGGAQLEQIPQPVLVRRAFAMDAARHLSIRGNYPKLLALPDRWSSWCFAAIAQGLRLIRKHQPRCIWSTYPIATAHLIGLTLHKITGLPWVADFRDTMTEETYPEDATTWKFYRWIEQRAVEDCSFAVFTSPGAVTMYTERYSQLPRNRWKLILNGYDEEDFVGLEPGSQRPSSCRLTLLHSGVLYASERNPDAFFCALRELRWENRIGSCNLKIVLRGSGDDDRYRRQIHEFGLEEVVFVETTIPYHEALEEMMTSDGLLVFQAGNCNQQIPAKVFEYLRAQKPILTLTDPNGDTAALMRAVGMDSVARLDSIAEIKSALMQFLADVRDRKSPVPSLSTVAQYSRKNGARDLASILDSFPDQSR